MSYNSNTSVRTARSENSTARTNSMTLNKRAFGDKSLRDLHELDVSFEDKMADLARPNYGVTGLDESMMDLHVLPPLDSQSVDSEFGKQADEAAKGSNETIRLSNGLVQEKDSALLCVLTSTVVEQLDSNYNRNRFGGFIGYRDYEDHFQNHKSKMAHFKEQNPRDKDAINIIRYRRRRAKKDEPGHVATALYKSRQKRIIIYDSSGQRYIMEQYKDQLRAYHIHTEEDYVKVAMSHGYTTQDNNYTCAYYALFATVLLLNEKNPDHYLMNNDGMWRMIKMATETPNEMPDTVEELSKMVAWPKEEKKKVRLNYYPLKSFIQVAPTKSTFESTSATSVGPAESALESSSATIAIKYMDGVLKPATTTLAASEAGVDIVDVAVDSMSGMTSQPSMGAVVHSLRGAERDTGIDIDAHSAYNTYWEQTRRLYAPFEGTTTMRSGNADVFKHEIPGGQYTNLQFQSVSLNLQDQFNQVTDNYHEANIALGDIIKVTPSSKVTGDLAQVMTQNNIKSSAELLDKADSVTFLSSVVQFFEGKLGQPPYGFPKELTEKVLRGKSPMEGRPGAQLKPMDMENVKRELQEKMGMKFSDFDVMSSIMFPTEFEEMVGFRNKYGPVDKLPTNGFFAGPPDQNELTIGLEEGKNLLVKFVGLGEINEKGEREVHFEFNGHYRNLFVKDKESTKGIASRVKALKEEPGHIGAPMKETILDVKVKVGYKVAAKQTLYVLSAMKIEIAVESKIAGIASDVILKTGETVEAEDLIIIVKAN